MPAALDLKTWPHALPAAATHALSVTRELLSEPSLRRGELGAGFVAKTKAGTT